MNPYWSIVQQRAAEYSLAHSQPGASLFDPPCYGHSAPAPTLAPREHGISYGVPARASGELRSVLPNLRAPVRDLLLSGLLERWSAAPVARCQ